MKKYVVLICMLLFTTIIFVACSKADNIDSVTTSTIVTKSVLTTIETTIKSTETSKPTEAETTTSKKAENQTIQRDIASTTKKSATNNNSSLKNNKPSSSRNSNSKPSGNGASSNNNSGGNSSSSTGNTSKPVWCWEGGSKHVTPDGIGWYSSYNEAKKAGLAYIGNSGSSGSWEVQECDCGKFTVYVTID